MQEYVYVYVLVYYVCLVVWSSISDSFARSELGNEQFRFVWLRTRYTADSNTDIWDDPEIYISLCSEDQTVIRIQNHVISCEYLLLYHFLFIVVSIINILPVLFHVIIWYILLVWLPVSFHGDDDECSLYLFSWYEHLFVSFYVIVGHSYWFRTVCGKYVTWFDLLINWFSAYLRIEYISYA